MTHPTHGLDPNALGAASQAVVAEWKAICFEANQTPGDVARDFVSPGNFRLLKAAISAYLAALSQNPGTSNTSGEAVGVRGLEWSRDDVGNDVATTICGPYVVWTEGIDAVGYWSLGYGGVRTQAPDRAAAKAAAQADYEQRIYAALEPRASDRELTIEECAKVADEYTVIWSRGAAATSNAPSVRVGAGREIAAAIRKLSEVSHER